jgi:hypothetical protein
VAVIAAAMYLFYNRAVAFGRDLPRYSVEIHAMVAKITANTSKIEQNTSKVLKGPDERKPIPVEVQQGPSLFRFLEGGQA